MQLGIPVLFTSLVLQTKLVGGRAEFRLPLFKTTWARVAPAIAPATVLFAARINFTCYRNVTRVLDRWVYVLGGRTTCSEIFVHCQHRICFHNSSFYEEGCGSREKCAPQRLAFSLQKLLCGFSANSKIG
jgi:hypothetical protein